MNIIFIIGLFVSLISIEKLHSYDGKLIARPANEKPAQVQNVGIDENLGHKLDLNLLLKNEKGEEVKLGSFYDGVKPVVISLVYFGCPGLCNFHLNGVIETLKGVDWSAGDKFQVLAISFDPHERSDLAVSKKKSYLKLYDRAQADQGLHFLTADESAIKIITKQIGFRYYWDEKANEWAHASAAVITTADGTISRYLHGIMFDAKTFRFALAEATNGSIGTFVDQFIWYCFHYDPKASKYTIYAFRLVQVGGILIVAIMGFFLAPFLIRARRVL